MSILTGHSGGEIVSLRVCVLASGSSGNCVYISSGSSTILIDAGITGKAMVERLDASMVTSPAASMTLSAP